MGRSFHNKFLRVNLTDGTIKVEEPGIAYLRRYMGGWNVVLDVLLKEVPPGADPLGPQNKLVFAAGVLAGLPISGASRNAVGAKSPLNGGFGVGEVGAAFGAEMKRAGFDAIIVEGVAPKPVYLYVKDGVAELRDATHLWGQPTKETWQSIQVELGDKRVHCAMIGPGGENLVRYACVMNGLFDAAGRTGMGAVMGSKKLKAVVARGTNPLEAANPEKIRAMAKEMARAVNAGERAQGFHSYGTGRSLAAAVATGNLPTRNFRDGDFEHPDAISADVYMEGPLGNGMEGCWACAVRCKKKSKGGSAYNIDRAYGGPEYESVGALGSCCGVSDINAIFKATELCNAYSLDTISCGVTIAWAMECFEKGLLTLKDTEGIDLRFGNGDAVVQMVGKIARREGLGNLLAEGTKRAARQVGGGSEFWAMNTKGNEYPMHEPRLKRGLAIGYSVSPTGADHGHSLHDPGLINPNAEGLMPDENLRSLGVLEPMPLQSLGPEKVRAVLYHTRYAAAVNCLVSCRFVPWTTDELTQIVQAATGWDVSTYELMKVGERALNLARVYNLREGLTAADDKLAPRSHGPTTSGALADAGIDAEELDEAVHEFYAMSGWDRETGTPSAGKLHELDVGWATKYLK